jgi:hypothetical protein
MARDQEPRPVYVTRPPKPISRMTDEERHAWAVEIVKAMRRRRDDQSTGPN